MSDPISIIRVPADRIVDLRHRVLRQGLPRAAAIFDGDSLPTTMHVAAINNQTVIGCATILLSEWEAEAACQLRGMAVDPNVQTRGIGRQILQEIEQIAREHGRPLLWANCRKIALGFYLKMGWQVKSEEFEIPTAGPHFKMMKRLTGRGGS